MVRPGEDENDEKCNHHVLHGFLEVRPGSISLNPV